MDKNVSEAITYAAIWLSTGAAVLTAVIVTGSATPLWFMAMAVVGTVAFSRIDKDE